MQQILMTKMLQVKKMMARLLVMKMDKVQAKKAAMTKKVLVTAKVKVMVTVMVMETTKILIKSSMIFLRRWRKNKATIASFSLALPTKRNKQQTTPVP